MPHNSHLKADAISGGPPGPAGRESLLKSSFAQPQDKADAASAAPPPSRGERRSSAGGRLLWWDEVPPVLQFNRYISSKYRANLTYKQCLCSVAAVHNETGNIWLHFLPCLVLLLFVIPQVVASQHVHWGAFLSVLVPEALCLLLSSAYHTFLAQVSHYFFWLRVDICGVFTVMMVRHPDFRALVTPADSGNWQVPYATTIWWGYVCQPHMRYVVLSLYYASAALGLLTAAFAKSVLYRALPMGMLVMVRLLSLGHRAWLGTASAPALWHYFVLEIVSSIGATVNVLRVPERWLHTPHPIDRHKAQPLDCWGNSHQIMHVLSVVSMWHIYQGTRLDSEHILANLPCPT